MVFRQFHYTKRDRFMPFLLAEILNFQGSTHRIGVGSFSYSVWMAEKKDPALSFQRQYKVLSLLFSLMPVPFPLTSYPESFFLFSS